MNLIENVRKFQYFVTNVISHPVVSVVMNGAQSIAEVLAVVNDPKSSKWSVAKTLLTAASDFAHKNQTYPYEHFSRGWCQFMPEIKSIVLDIIKDYEYVDLRSNEDECAARIHNFHGFSIGYVAQDNPIRNDEITIWIKGDVDVLQEAENVMYDVVWKRFKSDHVVLQSPPVLMGDSTLNFMIDDVEHRGSALLDEYVNYANLCLAKNLNRSFLFYGPPGTGKSTLMRGMIAKLGLRSFRVNLSNVKGVIVNSSTIVRAVEIFKPDVLIIDDLDRLGSHDNLLSLMETFHQKFKFILVSANNLNQFDEAMLRPGRFDHLIEVRSLDFDVVRGVLGSELVDYVERVKFWPVKFIEELRNRFEVQTPEQFKLSFLELKERVKKNCRGYDMPEFNEDEEPSCNDSEEPGLNIEP